MAQINKPNTYFNSVLYTGNGSTQSITGVNFQPDMTWIKSRSAGSWHHMGDVVRGADKRLQTNSTNAESTATTGITSWDSDGFSLGSNGDTNASSATFASWNWLAGGTAVSNTQGSITSSVSANTTSGFSIVSYTGNGNNAVTVGHGLGAVPKMMIVRPRNYADHWSLYHTSLGATKYLSLDNTDAPLTSNTRWSDTAPTSSVFTIGTNSPATGGGYTYNYIAYCFAEKKGFSKFGSYVGNGSADGAFVYTGFKPAWVWIRRYDTTENWLLMDNKRDIDNTVQGVFLTNLSDSEYTGIDRVDFLSNGFKCRNAGGGVNTSGGSYLYACFAEQPLVGTNNIPATAR